MSDSPSHFCERGGASEMHSTLLAARLHAHIPVCAFPVLLEASAHSVPGLFSPEPCMKYARTQAEHRRAGIQRQKLKEKSQRQITEALEGGEPKRDLGWYGRERTSRMMEVIHERSGMRKREYVKVIKRNWGISTWRQEGEIMKKKDE